EVMNSMPSIPDSESSSGLVTWDSMISALAPLYRVSTVTTGSSMFGYSRTGRRKYEIKPISTTITLRTVAKTGRLMQRSDRNMDESRPGAGSAARGRRRRRTFGYDDGRTVLQLDLAGSDHDVAFREPLADLDGGADSLADDDLGHDGLAVDHLEHRL